MAKEKVSIPVKTRLKILIFTFIFDSLRRRNLTINRRILGLIDPKTPPNPSPDRNGVSTHDFSFDPSIRLFIPTNSRSASIPVILYFHGGGFVSLGASSAVYDSLCRRLSYRLSAVVASVEYRLAPEHKFPAQYDDAFAALRYLRDSSLRKGESIHSLLQNADISKCFMAGDSAGGNIAHHTSVKAAEQRISDIRVLGTIAIQPFFGGEELSESETRMKGDLMVSNESTLWMWRAFLPDGVGLDHWACDVSGPNSRDLLGLDLPATMVVVGGLDPLQDGQRRYGEWLKESGKEVSVVEYPKAFHGFNVFPEVPDSSKVIDDIKVFIDYQISKVV